MSSMLTTPELSMSAPQDPSDAAAEVTLPQALVMTQV